MITTSLFLSVSLGLASPSLPDQAGAAAEPAGEAPIVLATWRVHQEGDDWFIRDGNESVEMPDEKTAKKTARKFNRIEKKAERQEGVMDNGDGPCGDPTSGILC